LGGNNFTQTSTGILSLQIGGSMPGKRLAENNLSVCGYFSAVFSSQHLSLSGQYFGAGLCGHIV